MKFSRLINTRLFGQAQEAKAARYLCAQGLRLLAKNYHSKFGEIDLIMSTSNTLVFVEVRYRANEQFGGALNSVTVAKQKKIRLTAAHYLQAHPKLQHSNCRFDVIGLSPHSDAEASEPHFDWIKNAFY